MLKPGLVGPKLLYFLYYTAIASLLPYSVFDLELTSRQYRLSRFWRWVERRRAAGNPLGFLINVRNLRSQSAAGHGGGGRAVRAATITSAWPN